MNDVIDQIAIAAERDSLCNFLWGASKFSNLLRPEEKRQEDLSPERIRELDQAIRTMGHLPPPRLKIDEINAILSDYPYKLPVEFYELYQRGNGVLPIGVGDKDWDCYINYFYFPPHDISWTPLHEAMDEYRYGYLRPFNEGQSNVPPKIFPLMSFERRTWAISGSETQQPTSPIFHFSIDDYQSWENPTFIVWNSLTEMFADDLSESANWSKNIRNKL